MKRQEMLSLLKQERGLWDLIIIGGGASGLGAAVDAAARGYKTLLVEQSDFAKGTSSRSTKLIHGGVRYLQQGNISLVIEALHERGVLCQNAPHLIHHLPLLVPAYSWWEKPFYGAGLKFYDLLAGKLGLERSHCLSLEETLCAVPTLEPHGLRGGVIYFDGQFDDARLAITLAQTAAHEGACLLNYCKVEGLIKKNERIVGVTLREEESQELFDVEGRTVINATGVFTDEILRMDVAKSQKIIVPSQGIHLVFDRSFLPGKTAILIPRTTDKRVLFIIPWLGHVLVGTTDTAVRHPSLEPHPQEKEIDFLLETSARYLVKDPSRMDILSIFAGLRPLVKPKRIAGTASISREHVLITNPSGLITIAGGKWTTYRKMGEDVVNRAIEIGGLPKRDCSTQHLKLHGWIEANESIQWEAPYGSKAPELHALIRGDSTLGRALHPRLPFVAAQFLWAARHEMARTIEDALARRTRALFLDARASLAMAPTVAALMAQELNHDQTWQEQQVRDYTQLVKTYLA
jgi:glycerol-3-phosphate dehydrogenase